MKIYQVCIAATATLSLLGSIAQADDQRGPPAAVKAAIQACASEVGVSFTEGRRPELTDAQKEQMRSCMQAKGVQPPHGDREHGRGGPGRHEDFEKMKACLADAGVTLPEHVPGQRPELDDATRAAMQACHEKVRQESSTSPGSSGSSNSNGVVSSSAI